MNRSIRRPWGFLLPLGALTAFLVFNPLREEQHTNAESGTPPADYELNGSRIDRLDDAGRLSLRLFTRTASHIPARAGTTLTEVTLLQPNEQTVPNRLQAPSGFIPDDRGLPMRLAAPVQIEIQDRHTGLPWKIEAGDLEYRSQTQQLHSSSPVTLTQGGNRLVAQALDADLRQGQVVLLGQVRARYVP